MRSEISIRLMRYGLVVEPPLSNSGLLLLIKDRVDEGPVSRCVACLKVPPELWCPFGKLSGSDPVQYSSLITEGRPVIVFSRHSMEYETHHVSAANGAYYG